MAPSNKPKRGTPYIDTITGDNVWLNRVVDEKTYFVCTTQNQKAPDAGFYRIKVKDLKPLFKQKATINKVSAKRKEENKIYKTLRAVFLNSKPLCEAKLKNCTIQSTEVHHKAGRLKNMLNIKTWLAVCSNCHSWIETHPAEAKEKGLSMDRL